MLGKALQHAEFHAGQRNLVALGIEQFVGVEVEAQFAERDFSRANSAAVATFFSADSICRNRRMAAVPCNTLRAAAIGSSSRASGGAHHLRDETKGAENRNLVGGRSNSALCFEGGGYMAPGKIRDHHAF
jgi:hypothetical protein